jgi:hypothetical protein
MIKVTFKVDDDFTTDNLIRVLSVNDAYDAMDEVLELFRDPRKYGTFNDKVRTEQECDLLEEVHGEIWKILKNVPGR